MPSWIVFELVVTKLPHYVLPLYPAIAILIAGDRRCAPVVARAEAGCAGAIWWFVVAVLAGIIAIAAPS